MRIGSSDPSTMLVTDTHPIYSVTATEHSVSDKFVRTIMQRG